MPLVINVNCEGGKSDCCNQLIEFNIDLEVHVPVTVINEINALPGGQVDNGYQPPSTDWADYNGYVTTKCQYANQLAVDTYNTWENLGTLALSAAAMSFPAFSSMLASGALISSISGLIAGAVSTAALATAIVGIIVAVGTIFGIGFYVYFENLQAEMDIDTLRCLMYDATDAQDAQAKVLAQFNTWGVSAGIDVAGGEQFLEYMVMIARFLAPVTLFEPLFDLTDYVGALPVADCSLCTGVIPAPGPITLPAALRHYWSFESADSIVDDHASANLGISNGTLTLQTGITGQAVFNDSTESERISSGGTAGFEDMVNDQAWSFVGWIFPMSFYSPTPIIGRGQWNSPSDVQTHFFLYTDNTGKLNAKVGTATGLQGPVATPALVLNQWNMVVMTLDPVTRDVGVSVNNSVLEYVTASTLNVSGAAVYVTMMSFRAGSSSWGPQSFHGAMDESAWFAKAIVQEEVNYMWNVGQGLSYANLS